MKRLEDRNGMIAKIIVATVAFLAVVVGLIVMSGPSSVRAAPNPAPSVTRQQVLDTTAAKKSIVLRADRMEAKLTTWGSIQAARNAAADQVASLQPAQQVWIVAVGGDFLPQLSRGEHFTWGAIVYDANVGNQVATFAGGDGTWPSFFSALRDLSP